MMGRNMAYAQSKHVCWSSISKLYNYTQICLSLGHLTKLWLSTCSTKVTIPSSESQVFHSTPQAIHPPFLSPLAKPYHTIL